MGGSAAVVATTGPRRSPLMTLAWVLPGTIWLLLFLIAPLLMIVLVSVWERTPVGFQAFSFSFDAYAVYSRQVSISTR